MLLFFSPGKINSGCLVFCARSSLRVRGGQDFALLLWNHTAGVRERLEVNLQSVINSCWRTCSSAEKKCSVGRLHFFVMIATELETQRVCWQAENHMLCHLNTTESPEKAAILRQSQCLTWCRSLRSRTCNSSRSAKTRFTHCGQGDSWDWADVVYYTHARTFTHTLTCTFPCLRLMRKTTVCSLPSGRKGFQTAELSLCHKGHSQMSPGQCCGCGLIFSLWYHDMRGFF